MDAQEQLVWDAEVAAAVLANGSDVELIDIQPVLADKARSFAERGLACVGVIGLVDGEPRVALDVEMDSETVATITKVFVAHVRKNVRWTAQPDLNAN